MKPEDTPKGGKGLEHAKGQQKTYDITGTDPATGEPLPDRTVTQAEWRQEKLGKAGYVKPEDMDESEDVPPTSSGV